MVLLTRSMLLQWKETHTTVASLTMDRDPVLEWGWEEEETVVMVCVCVCVRACVHACRAYDNN